MSRTGVVLVEVLAALMVLGFAGLSALTYVSSLTASLERTIDREREMERAERVMIRHTLMSRDDLAIRLGVRSVEAFVVWVDRPRPSLFRIGVATAGRPDTELLAALVYRPEPEVVER